MDYSALADLLFPGIDTTPADIEARYPARVLPEGAKVTRMAPSPTGFMHLGNLFGAIADERLAHQSGGVFYLRIEDTDQKREVPGAVETILQVFSDYELPFDEGATVDGTTAFTGRTDSGSAHRSIRRMPNGLSGRVRHIHASARRTSLRRSARSRRNVRKILATTANGPSTAICRLMRSAGSSRQASRLCCVFAARAIPHGASNSRIL